MTEQRVSVGALLITVLFFAVLGGCTGDDLTSSPGEEPGVAYSEISAECGWWQPVVRLAQDAPAAIEGQDLTFFIDYSNEGPGPITSARLSASVPAGTSLLTASAGGAASGAAVSWNVGTLWPGQAGRASLTVRASGPGAYTSAAELRYRVLFFSSRRLESSQTAILEDAPPPDLTPVAVDDSASLDEDGSVLIAVRDNDSGGDGALSVAQVAAPQHGTAVIEDGQVRYTPAADFFGDDSFTYTIADADGDEATAQVTIAVAAVNDVPVANLDQFTFNEDGGLAELDVLANDTGLGDGPVTVVSFTPASHGTLTRDGNKMQYTPRANFNGTDIFTYTVRDADGQQASASVVLAVRPVNDPPVARDDAFAVIAGLSTSLGLLDNDFDPDGNGLTLVSVSAPLFGQVSIVNNRALFAAPLELFGLSTFTYTISDGQGGTATATVSLDVRLQ
jgi:Bacterial Ig domain/Domain of unknown function DUF11